MKTVENREKIIPRRILFVDFNGVISYNPFWLSLRKPQHPLHTFSEPIEQTLFGEKRIEGLINEWMLGKHKSESVHQILAERLGVSFDELFAAFCEDCKTIDISEPILEKVRALRKDWYCILKTDNMDSFHRFTLPSNPQLSATFDEIHNSYLLRQLKKTNNGETFVSDATRLGVSLTNCVLIDDSASTCRMFEDLGGRVFQPRNEAEAISALEELRTNYC
jgi:FMN phosphatase YigB (HAD superfamily)